MRRYVSLLLAGLLSAVLAAGCASPGELFQATTVPEAAPQEIGSGKFPIQIKVVRESGSGEAIPNAPIVIHHIPKPATAPTVHQLLRTNTSLAGRTGPDGILRANLDKGATYSFLTSVPNWTVEARHIVKITDEFREKPVLITVFQSTKRIEVTGTVPTTAKFDLPIVRVGGLISSPPLWFPSPVEFHSDPGANRQYTHRMMTATTKLTFTVDPPQFADLGVRAGFVVEGEKEAKIYWEANTPSPPVPFGTFTEQIKQEAGALAHGDSLKNARFTVGPYTTQGVFAPNGIKWVAEVEATFGTDPVALGPRPYMPAYTLPAPSAALLLVALAAGAFLLARRDA